MYQDMYERWLAAELDDADLKPELESVKGTMPPFRTVLPWP